MYEIKIVVPITTELRLEEHTDAMSDATANVSAMTITTGPESIEGSCDEAYAVPGTIKACIEAERQGADAIVIDCMGDPGVDAAREVVSIPVVGPSRTAMYVAASLGHNFGVITMLESALHLFDDMARLYGMHDRVACCRHIDIPVLELADDAERLTKALLAESVLAVEEDRADVLILGCTGMFGIAGALREGLADRGITGVPVVDPTPMAVEFAKGLVKVGLTHSRKAYAPPREKVICGYELA